MDHIPVVVGAGADVTGVDDCGLELSSPAKSRRSMSDVCCTGALELLDPLLLSL